jgi:hypothetical protein
MKNSAWRDIERLMIDFRSIFEEKKLTVLEKYLSGFLVVMTMTFCYD